MVLRLRSPSYKGSSLALKSGPSMLIFFAWWGELQQRLRRAQPAMKLLLVGVGVSLAVLLRFWAQTFPYNYDFTSYLIVSEAVLAGESPYETNRYNYGPIWFLILAGLRSVFTEAESFRLAITAFLALADVAIAAFIWKKGLPAAALLFLLLPVSISISGNHHQFDNVAVFLALVAADTFGRSRSGAAGDGRRFAIGVVLLSVSLMTKHVFILFPLWIALQEHRRRRVIVLAVPPLVWLASLGPSLLRSPEAVISNVFLYSSFNNAPLANLLLPGPFVDFLQDRSLLIVLFFIAMVTGGFIYRSLPVLDSALMYSVTMLLFSSAVADQYLAIPLVAAVVYFNAGFFVWILGATVYFWGAASATAISLSVLYLPSIALGNYQTYHVVPLLVAWILYHQVVMKHDFESRISPAQHTPRAWPTA